MSDTPYEVIIGLEVHVQLQTRSKLFCRCSTRFGAPPNTQTCPVCIGLPGALPVMNREAFHLALKTAVALDCEIPAFTKWDRKNYYYPDLPKGYQISQYDLPLSRHGYLEISDAKGSFPSKRVRILRAHLEEDAGKSMHDELAGKADSRIDLNRTGTPLLEIVSEPDIRSPQEAKAFLTELKLLLSYLDVSDCNMQEGSLRVDANINLHISTAAGVVATPIVEVKNMNSFRAVERALAFEAERQFESWRETGQKKGDVPKQTRGWDDQAQMTRGQRHKEESSDYRYFPDPDLVPVCVTPEQVAQVRQSLGELPSALRARLEKVHGLDPYDADVIVNQGRGLVAYFETVAQRIGDGKRASNWIQQDVMRSLNERNLTIEGFPASADSLAELLLAVQRQELDNTRAKEVFQRIVETGCSVSDAMQALGIARVDRSTLIALCREILAANPKALADLRDGKQKAVGALIGQARQRNANVNPGQAKETFLQLAAEADATQ
jgi:aspartyl-tRNA(Asn)/glutamyl-tRNA(Gln) amidotransferase subunit B